MEHFYSLEFILTYIITACGRVSDEIFFSTLHKDYGIKVQGLLKKKWRIGIKINIIKKKGYFVYFTVQEAWISTLWSLILFKFYILIIKMYTLILIVLN